MEVTEKLVKEEERSAGLYGSVREPFKNVLADFFREGGTPQNLKTHKLTHSGEKPHACD